MSSFEITVDASLKDSQNGEHKVVGVGFQIHNTSNGSRSKVVDDSFGYESNDLSVEEAELLGIYRSLYRLKRITKDERVVVVTVKNDNQTVIEQLQNTSPKNTIGEDIISLCDEHFYITHWEWTDSDNLYKEDYAAGKEANIVKHC